MNMYWAQQLLLRLFLLLLLLLLLLLTKSQQAENPLSPQKWYVLQVLPLKQQLPLLTLLQVPAAASLTGVPDFVLLLIQGRHMLPVCRPNHGLGCSEPDKPPYRPIKAPPIAFKHV
jgi:hypothetical protein